MPLTFARTKWSTVRKGAPGYCPECKATCRAVRASESHPWRCRLCGAGAIVSRAASRPLLDRRGRMLR
ncbi:MAG: hypothetical protein M5U26_16805 [Planctomycetota bacterium]|nr:hypothetical protein [Planctomycetota bacterium]